MAQDEFKRGFSAVGITIAPSRAFYTYTMHDTSQLKSNPIRDEEQPTLGSQLSITTSYKINPKLDAILRLGLTTHGTESPLYPATFSSYPIDTNSPPSNTVTFFKHYEYFHFFDLSIGVRYYYSDKKIKAYVNPSIEGNYFRKSFSEMMYQYTGSGMEFKRRDQTGDYNFLKFNATIGIGTGFTFPLYKKLDGLVEVKYRKMLFKIADELVQLKPYSIGLGLGLSYNL